MRHSRHRQEDAATISLNPRHLEERWRSKLAEVICSMMFQSVALFRELCNGIS
jgi:hypothetical protein